MFSHSLSFAKKWQNKYPASNCTLKQSSLLPKYGFVMTPYLKYIPNLRLCVINETHSFTKQPSVCCQHPTVFRTSNKKIRIGEYNAI